MKKQPFTRDEFDALVLDWDQDTAHYSKSSMRVNHPSYRAIVAFGAAAIPFMLDDMKRGKRDWFEALDEIVANMSDPLTAEQRRANWLKWGRERGYVM